jgi:hypothetical protein
LTGYFWIDAVCINQQDIAERTSQVRAMSETYGNASMVAAWIGPCDDVIRPLFRAPIETILIFSGRTTASDPMLKACEALATRRYWSRIWIQQEMLLQTNVMLFCGEHQQPLYPLITWFQRSNYQVSMGGDFFGRLSRFQKLVRHPTLLEVVYYFWRCEAKDRRDKIFALISLLEGSEREALNGILPDYSLSVGEVIKVVLRHIRRFSGQRRCAKQLDSVLQSLGEPGDSQCGRATFREYMALQRSAKDGCGSRRAITLDEKERYANSFILYGEISWLEIFRCIFSPPAGQRQGSAEVWELDPDLSPAREQHLLTIRRHD